MKLYTFRPDIKKTKNKHSENLDKQQVIERMQLRQNERNKKISELK